MIWPAGAGAAGEVEVGAVGVGVGAGDVDLAVDVGAEPAVESVIGRRTVADAVLAIAVEGAEEEEEPLEASTVRSCCFCPLGSACSCVALRDRL